MENGTALLKSWGAWSEVKEGETEMTPEERPRSRKGKATGQPQVGGGVRHWGLPLAGPGGDRHGRHPLQGPVADCKLSFTAHQLCLPQDDSFPSPLKTGSLQSDQKEA